MITIAFTEAEQAELEHRRYTHLHPKVQRRMEALYLKSFELPHHLICRMCKIEEPTFVRYLRLYANGGIDALKVLGYKGQTSSLKTHEANLEEHFKKNPPHSVAHAKEMIEAITGICRGLTQVLAFMRRMKMKYRKTGFVPGKSDTPEKQAEQEEFLKKNRPGLGGSQSGKAGGAFARCRPFRLWCFSFLCMECGPHICSIPLRA